VAEAEGADGPKTLPANPRVIIYRGARRRAARPRPDGPIATMTTGDNDHDRGSARPYIPTNDILLLGMQPVYIYIYSDCGHYNIIIIRNV